MKTLALGLLLLTYGLLLLFPLKRSYIALISAGVFVFAGILPIDRVMEVIDLNVLMILVGTMGIVSLFIESRMPTLLADILIDRTNNIRDAILAMALFAGVISAFIDNVATVLMLAPIALDISKKLNISPVPSIIAISISSNLQGAATLVGDTTSIILGGYANLNFYDFFFFKGNMGIFWVIQGGALASLFVLFYIFKNMITPIKLYEKTKVNDIFPTLLLVSMVILLIIASFIPGTPKTINGIICLSLMIIGLVKDYFTKKNSEVLLQTLWEIDFHTIGLLTGLFIVIGGIREAGVIDEISTLFLRFGNNNLFVIYTLLVWASVLFSAFIDNIPYVATMLPVTATIAQTLNIEPYILYFGLLSGATLGGNITPIGASANIASLGLLKKEGYNVTTKEFMRISVPFTLVAVTVGYILIWFIWT